MPIRQHAGVVAVALVCDAAVGVAQTPPPQPVPVSPPAPTPVDAHPLPGHGPAPTTPPALPSHPAPPAVSRTPGPFVVTAAGGDAVLLDTRSGRTWVLRRGERQSVWLPVRRVDTAAEAREWETIEAKLREAERRDPRLVRTGSSDPPGRPPQPARPGALSPRPCRFRAAVGAERELGHHRRRLADGGRDS